MEARLPDDERLRSGALRRHPILDAPDETEARIALSELRYRSLVEATTSVVFTTDPRGAFVEPQRGWEDYTGQGWEVHQGFGWSRAVHHDDLDRVEKSRLAALEEKRIVDVEGRVWHARTGSYRHCVARAVPILDEHGSVYEWIGTITDVHEREESDRALKKQRAEQQIIFDSVPAMIWYKDCENRILRLNRPAAASMKKSVGELEGCSTYDLYPDEAAQYHKDDLEVIRSGRSKLGIIEPLRTASGEKRWIQTDKVPYRDGTGRIIGVIVFATDITERMRAEEGVRTLNRELERRVLSRTAELQAALTELEAFSYSVSHDLRAPLRAMAGYSAALIEDTGGKLDPAQLKQLGRIQANCQHMAALIDDLLSLARLSRDDMRKETVDISSLAGEIADSIRPAEPSREVEFVIAPGLSAEADPRFLHMVLDNLLRNAWKFTSKVPHARIEFGAAPDPAADPAGRTFFVRDNGAGFDMAHATRLFRPFERLHTMSEFPGSGIGLAIVQRIIARHGGRVWAEGVEGQGATFSFTLPQPGKSPV
ncbi:MAG: sensor histidine kinase [Planctomycetota bacterium]